MNIQILQEAEDELNEAVAYYEQIEMGLGIRLKEEVRGAIKWVQENHDVPRLRPNGYRRLNLRIFRYYIAYVTSATSANTIWIVAIAHSSRKPDYWITRKSRIT